MSADKRQEGGSHYKDIPDELQHWNVVAALGWDYFIGNATKYLWRLGKKGDASKALEDISKSIHYLEKKRELMTDELTLVKVKAMKLRQPPALDEEYCDYNPDQDR